LPSEHCAANDDASFLAWIDRWPWRGRDTTHEPLLHRDWFGHSHTANASCPNRSLPTPLCDWQWSIAARSSDLRPCKVEERIAQTIAASTALVSGGLMRGVEASYSKVRIGAARW